MRVLTLATAALFASLAFAGCLDDDDEPTDEGVEASGLDAFPTGSMAAAVAAGRAVWVTDADQSFLPASAYPGELPWFTQKTPSQRISGEPTIGITRDHAVFYPAIDFDQLGGLPDTRFMRSVDGGDTWDDVSPNIYDVIMTHPYSFDPYVYVDPTTSRVYALDMGPNFNCNHVSWSDDNGGTWLTQYFTCPVPIVDHPSIFAGPPSAITLGGLVGPSPATYQNAVYVCTNGLQIAHCVQSLDGGLTWLEFLPVFTECGGLTGHGHASWTDGTVYLPRVGCGVPQVGISRDGGLTWDTVDVSTDPEFAGIGHEAIVATDTAGTAYIVWQGDEGNATFLAHSTDQGATWSTPVNVTLPGVTAVKLPSITAGSPGRVAFLYVGTTTPSGHAVGETGDDGERVHRDEWLNATWHGFVGVGLNADSDDPVFATTTFHALDEPIKRGDCVGRCFGDVGGMYDFFDIDNDPIDGRVWIAAVDVCTLECDLPGADAETFQRTFGAVGKQAAGTFLRDEPIEAR